MRSDIIDPTILNSAKQRRYMSSDTNFATYSVPVNPYTATEAAVQWLAQNPPSDEEPTLP